MRRALILGINGQDGSYLAEILLKEGYIVHGMVRRNSTWNQGRIDHISHHPALHIHQGDLLDPGSLREIITTSQPDEVYNMADQDEIGYSYLTPAYSADVTFKGVVHVLEAVFSYDDRVPITKVYQPVSATMFGHCHHHISELECLNPQSPYAVAKAAAYHLCRMYRYRYGMFVSTGICFNHDSPRRQGNYLLQKICREAVRIKREIEEEMRTHWPLKSSVRPMVLGDGEASVDIGFAEDYARAAYRIMNLNKPDDFILATGIPYQIKDLVIEACVKAGLLEYLGGADYEKPLNPWVRYDKSVIGNRPSPTLIGDSAKAFNAGVWECNYDAMGMVKMLVEHFKEKK